MAAATEAEVGSGVGEPQEGGPLKRARVHETAETESEAVTAVEREFADVLQAAKRTFAMIDTCVIFQGEFESVHEACFAGSKKLEMCVEDAIKRMKAAVELNDLFKDTVRLRKRVLRNLLEHHPPPEDTPLSAEDARTMLKPTRRAIEALTRVICQGYEDADDSGSDNEDKAEDKDT